MIRGDKVRVKVLKTWGQTGPSPKRNWETWEPRKFSIKGSERLFRQKWLSLQRAVALFDEHLHFALSLV
jgi:hypothetical protein